MPGCCPYITCCLPITIPALCRFFQSLNGSLIFSIRASKLNLGLLQLVLVLAFFLAHDHVTLGKISLDSEAVLLVAISCLLQVSISVMVAWRLRGSPCSLVEFAVSSAS